MFAGPLILKVAGAAAASAAALVLAVAGPAAAQVHSLPGESIAQRLLAAHNAERQRLGIKPLTWNAKLADHAKAWSQALAVSDMMEHSVAAANADEGENLWFGTKGDFTLEEMVGYFIDEGKLFKKGLVPDISTTARWEDVGHYTQLIWQDTREVGCAVTSNQRRDVLVCRYAPAGNVTGQRVYDYGQPAAVNLPKPRKRAVKKRRRGG